MITKSNQTNDDLHQTPFLVPPDDRGNEQPKGTVRTKQQRQRNKGKNRHKSENVDDDGNVMENEVCVILKYSRNIFATNIFLIFLVLWLSFYFYSLFWTKNKSK